ncbi:MAG: hypothetical protein R3E84_07605 [Pseudomonadales bacterium]|nr:hypothetical protein [Pseudomonadales bacterium]
MDTYYVTAENHATSSENRIHSDDIAARLGFRGALVPGVAVFGYMTHPLVETFGEDWLTRNVSDVRFLKPAYVDDRLAISVAPQGDGLQVNCHNDQGELLAVMATQMPEVLPPELDATAFAARETNARRVTIEWDRIELNHPFPVFHWSTDARSNDRNAMQVADTLPHYRTFVHPHWFLGIANFMLVRQFVMPAWIHVGSNITIRRPLLVDRDVDVLAVPLEKWKKKGHEFVRLAIRYQDGDGVLADVLHTAIYRVAGT